MAYSDPLVVKIPLPENVDPDWIIKLSDEENPGSPGFNAGAYLGFSNIVAWMGLSNTILGRIPHGHSIQPATMENPFRHVSRALVSTPRIYVYARIGPLSEDAAAARRELSPRRGGHGFPRPLRGHSLSHGLCAEGLVGFDGMSCIARLPVVSCGSRADSVRMWLERHSTSKMGTSRAPGMASLGPAAGSQEAVVRRHTADASFSWHPRVLLPRS